jgi:hypothetical protein
MRFAVNCFLRKTHAQSSQTELEQAEAATLSAWVILLHFTEGRLFAETGIFALQ